MLRPQMVDQPASLGDLSPCALSSRCRKDDNPQKGGGPDGVALQQLPASLLAETEIIPKVFVEPSTPGDEVTVTTRPQRQHEPHPSPTSESNRKESEWNQPPCLGDAVASQSLGVLPSHQGSRFGESKQVVHLEKRSTTFPKLRERHRQKTATSPKSIQGGGAAVLRVYRGCSPTSNSPPSKGGDTRRMSRGGVAISAEARVGTLQQHGSTVRGGGSPLVGFISSLGPGSLSLAALTRSPSSATSPSSKSFALGSHFSSPSPQRGSVWTQSPPNFPHGGIDSVLRNAAESSRHSQKVAQSPHEPRDTHDFQLSSAATTNSQFESGTSMLATGRRSAQSLQANSGTEKTSGDIWEPDLQEGGTPGPMMFTRCHSNSQSGEFYGKDGLEQMDEWTPNTVSKSRRTVTCGSPQMVRTLRLLFRGSQSNRPTAKALDSPPLFGTLLSASVSVTTSSPFLPPLVPPSGNRDGDRELPVQATVSPGAQGQREILSEKGLPPINRQRGEKVHRAQTDMGHAQGEGSQESARLESSFSGNPQNLTRQMTSFRTHTDSDQQDAWKMDLSKAFSEEDSDE